MCVFSSYHLRASMQLTKNVFLAGEERRNTDDPVCILHEALEDVRCDEAGDPGQDDAFACVLGVGFIDPSPARLNLMPELVTNVRSLSATQLRGHGYSRGIRRTYHIARFSIASPTWVGRWTSTTAEGLVTIAVRGPR